MTAEGDRMAQCRRDFIEAMELGCSIPELRARRRDLRIRASREVERHTDDLADASHRQTTEFLRFDASWMMRD